MLPILHPLLPRLVPHKVLIIRVVVVEVISEALKVLAWFIGALFTLLDAPITVVIVDINCHNVIKWCCIGSAVRVDLPPGWL